MSSAPLPPIEIAVQRLPNGGGLPLPSYASEGAAGLDVVAAESLTLRPGQRHAVATGIAMAIPAGWEVQVRPRSGLALKHGITCLNSPGTIDSDYRGEVMVSLRADGNQPKRMAAGDRIAQAMIIPIPTVTLIEVDELTETERGVGGFGSTGVA